MRPANKLAAALAALLLGAAADAPSADDLYDKGEYRAAAEAGAALNTAKGYALAARATLAEATLRDQPCLECLQYAESLARQGIAADPSYFENYIEMAAAMGYEARIIGPLKAERQDFPSLSKTAIDKARMLAPNDPFVLSAAGGWNIEVVRMGGLILGGMLFGADADDGVALYRKALSADRGNLVIAFNYVLALTSFDFERKRLEIMAVLDSIAHGTPRDAYAEALKMRAIAMLDLLNHDMREPYRVLARRYLGFPEGQ